MSDGNWSDRLKDMTPRATHREIQLDVLRKSVQIPIQRELAETFISPQVSIEHDQIQDHLILTVSAGLLGGTVEQLHFTAPADWREALKDRWLPLRLRKRFPVKYREVTVNVLEYYPRLKLPTRADGTIALQVIDGERYDRQAGKRP
jgi:hypothetical protein